MVPSFDASHYPAGREVKPRDQSAPDVAAVSDANEPSPTVNDPGSGNDPNSTPTSIDHFVPSSALNNPQPWTTQTPAPSTIVSTSNLPVSSSITLSTDTLQPTPTAVSAQGGASSTSSSNKKYIIGGAVGGGVLVLILLGLLLFCCCKRRNTRDLERSKDGDSEGQHGQHGYGQFACCNHGTCNRNGGQPPMEQKTPLKPFVLKSAPAVPTTKECLRKDSVPLNRRDSAESQESAGSDSSGDTLYSSDSGGSRPGKRRSQKRPPPLKLTSLVTPVINGPQNNPRRRADPSSLPSPREVPAIVVDPPQSRTPERMRRY